MPPPPTSIHNDSADDGDADYQEEVSVPFSAVKTLGIESICHLEGDDKKHVVVNPGNPIRILPKARKEHEDEYLHESASGVQEEEAPGVFLRLHEEDGVGPDGYSWMAGHPPAQDVA